MNRAFKYGDAVFETMVCFEGNLLLWSFHKSRLLASLSYLGMKISQEVLEEFVFERLEGTGVLRLQAYRKGGDFFDISEDVELQLEFKPMVSVFQDNDPISLGLYIENYKATSPLYNLKSANYLLYVHARQYANAQEVDDVLLVNGYGNIVEACTSNIFIVEKGEVYTPDLDSGPVGGVMRSFLMGQFDIREEPFDFQRVLEADEVFLTNAVKGIIPVKSFNGREKESKILASKWQEFLRKSLLKKD